MNEKTRAQILAENLSNIRQQKKISRKDLAAAVGVNEVSFGKYERAESSPSYDKLFIIADKLDCSITDLLGDNPNAKDRKVFEYRFQRALNLAKIAGLSISSYSNGLVITVTSTAKVTLEDGTTEIIPMIESYRVKDEISFVNLMDLSEIQSIKQNKPFIDVFKNNIKPTA